MGNNYSPKKNKSKEDIQELTQEAIAKLRNDLKELNLGKLVEDAIIELETTGSISYALTYRLEQDEESAKKLNTLQQLRRKIQMDHLKVEQTSAAMVTATKDVIATDISEQNKEKAIGQAAKDFLGLKDEKLNEFEKEYEGG